MNVNPACFGAIALAWAAMPSTAFATAGVYIEIDCHDLGLLQTSTDDTIEFQLWFGGKKRETKRVNFERDWPNALDREACPLNVNPASIGYTVYFDKEPSSDEQARDLVVRVVATGSDAFWIDQVRLHAAWHMEEHFGVDGKSGWCLSTDSGDSFGSDRQDGKCKKCVEFRPDGNGAGSCS
jgi:hypothetical protein